LEHLLEPVSVLASLRETLCDGGLIVVTVPSIHAWEPVEDLARSLHTEHLQLPIHLFHHSSKSLSDFLKAAGFEVLEVKLLRPHGYLSAVARRRDLDRENV
jgi:tRNA(Met) C34 N-acetyltransferase TmcA